MNARDSITGTGTVTIETRNIVLDDGFCKTRPDAVPGEYVLLSVSDTGCGMDREIQEKLFEPFFTTKEEGDGTGLGLSMVYGIVKQNGGYIDVYSEPGKGARFDIYLPRSAGAQEGMSPEDRRGALPRGQETILLVEDELALLNLAKQMLEVQGFPVLTASSPSEAIRLAKTYSGPIHLLVTDIIMPEMNGYELAGKLQALIPDLKCLFTSGYTRDVFERHGMPEDGVNFLAKPFSMQDFSRKVRDTLDEP